MLFSKYRKKSLYIVCMAGLVVAVCLAGYELNSRKQNAVQPAPQLSHEAYQAQKQQLLSILKEQGASASFIYLQAEAIKNPAVARECHPLLHQLGHGAYNQYGGFTGAMKYQNELCNSGYTHGVIESYFKASSDLPALVKTTCKNDTTRFIQWQCFHGIGHGVMLSTEKNVARSLELCRLLPDDFSVSSCANGLFMERFILVDHTGEHTVHDPSSVDITTCQSQPEQYKNDCYFYLPTAYLSLHSNKYKDALGWCAKAEKEYITTCISGTASQAMKENVTQPKIAAELCQKASVLLRANCVRGAIGLYINHSASSEAARPLCEHEFSAQKSTCLQVLDSKKQNLGI